MGGFQAGLKFWVHNLWFMGRDRLRPPLEMVRPLGLQPGDRVVDYGCGAGSYALPAADLVGPTGHVYAVDANPHAIRYVRDLVRERGLANVTVLESDRVLPLPSATVDVVMLNDVIHDLRDRPGVLRELHRVLKPAGALTIRDHHFSRQRLERVLTAQGLFRLVSSDRGLHRFAPQPATGGESHDR